MRAAVYKTADYVLDHHFSQVIHPTSPAFSDHRGCTAIVAGMPPCAR